MASRKLKTKTPKVRMKTINVGQLNITVHPHPKGVYQKLMTRAYELQATIQLARKERAVLGPVKTYPDDVLELVRVPIFRYYDLNPFGVWFDTVKRVAIPSTKDRPLSNIPANLKPDLRIVNAFLYVKKHRIIFDSTKITHSQAMKFFYELFQREEIIDEFGPVEVTIVQHPGMLEKVLSVPNMHSVQFIINRPNPDDDDEDEQRYEERMEEMGVYQWEQTLSAKSRTREPMLKIDDDLRSFANVALRNGEIKSTGFNEDGKRIELSSLETPYNEPIAIPSGRAFPDFVNGVKEQLSIIKR